jgi:putative adhesin
MTDQTGHYEFPCSGPIAASIRQGSGSLTITTTDAGMATVDVRALDGSEPSRAAAAETSVGMRGDQLTVETPNHRGGWVFRRGGQVRIEVSLPAQSTLRVTAGSADVQVDGDLADATVQTGSGDLELGRIGGRLSVQSGSGDVHADRVGGTLRAEAASGDVRIGLVQGEAHVGTASGDIRIDDVAGTVRAKTASGDVRIGSARGSLVRVDTASGDVEVGVPTGTSVWLDLTTLSGTTRSDLDVSATRPEGGTQLTVQVNTASGDITLHRTAAVATDQRPPAAEVQT